MAKICGFELKAVKEFKDHEGFPICQGNVYFNGKKLGFWSQDAWGGGDHYEFDTAPFEKAIENADLSGLEQFRDCYELYKITPNLDILLGEVLELKDKEKMYKKFAKDGHDKMVSFSDGERCCFVGTDADVDAKIDKYTELVMRKMGWKTKSDVETKVYDKDSFVIGETLAI